MTQEISSSVHGCTPRYSFNCSLLQIVLSLLCVVQVSLALDRFLLLTLFLPPHWPSPSLMDIIGMQSGFFCRHPSLSSCNDSSRCHRHTLAEFSELVSLLCISENLSKFAVLPRHLSTWCSSMRGPDSAGHLQENSGCKRPAYWSMLK